MEHNWKRTNGEKILADRESAGVPYLSFVPLEQSGLVAQGFSTRFGGASKGAFATMNFSYSRGDNPEDVLENYTRMARAMGVDRDKMVVSWQTHTTNVRQITQADAGKGVIRERDYRDVDGLITNVPGITLVTFYADCVPLYVLDPVKRAIGLSHSGWRGTVGRMGQVTVNAMRDAYGTDPADLIICIGPSICRDCFEVGPEVAEEFQEAFDQIYWKELMYGTAHGKYYVDLWKANRVVFEEAGVRPEQIYVTNICTRCNHENLFSHRIQGEKRGNLAAFLGLTG